MRPRRSRSGNWVSNTFPLGAGQGTESVVVVVVVAYVVVKKTTFLMYTQQRNFSKRGVQMKTFSTMAFSSKKMLLTHPYATHSRSMKKSLSCLFYNIYIFFSGSFQDSGLHRRETDFGVGHWENLDKNDQNCDLPQKKRMWYQKNFFKMLNSGALLLAYSRRLSFLFSTSAINVCETTTTVLLLLQNLRWEIICASVGCCFREIK